MNFNSHARVGRDSHAFPVIPPISISTHTPAWGVTWICCGVIASPPISTHTPAWGVTPRSLQREKQSWNFNSHARVGRDIRDHCFTVGRAISTHTPAWGVTIAIQNRRRCIGNFNSHARVGRDKINFPVRAAR